jgi:anti-sigma-K factor RskA
LFGLTNESLNYSQWASNETLEKAISFKIIVSHIQGTAEGSLQFAVTFEPAGGVPQPTGSMLLVGKPL